MTRVRFPASRPLTVPTPHWEWSRQAGCRPPPAARNTAFRRAKRSAPACREAPSRLSAGARPVASPVVFDAHDDLGGSCLETQLHAPGLCMLRRIGDRLLRDAIEICADARRQIVDLAGDGNVESGAALLEAVPARDQAFEAEREAEFLDVGRAQAHQRAAQRFHHARRGARDAPAFLEQRRTFALRRHGRRRRPGLRWR